MSMDELEARLNTIEQLLTVLCSAPEHRSAVRCLRDGLYDEYGVHLNKLFPSDPEYQPIWMKQRFMEVALDNIDQLAFQRTLDD